MRSTVAIIWSIRSTVPRGPDRSLAQYKCAPRPKLDQLETQELPLLGRLGSLFWLVPLPFPSQFTAETTPLDPHLEARHLGQAQFLRKTEPPTRMVRVVESMTSQRAIFERSRESPEFESRCDR
jgi:hypothetical protein